MKFPRSRHEVWAFCGVSQPFDPTHRFETSVFVSPLILGCIRLLIALYGWVGIIVQLALAEDVTAGQSFSYLSNITFWAISSYHLFAGSHTVLYALRGRAPLNSWPKFLQACHTLLYTTILCFPFLVTATFWAIQFKPSKFDTPYDAWVNTTRHALNTVFALFELIIPRTRRPPGIHCLFFVLFLGGYAGIAYITYATEGFYTYGFLDSSKYSPRALGIHMVAFGIGAVGDFCIVSGLIWLRWWWTEEKLEKPAKFSKRDQAIFLEDITVTDSLDPNEYAEEPTVTKA